MDSSEKEFARKLREAGERLSLLPTQVDVLLPLLDEVESLLKEVEQSPSELIQNAYSQSMTALLDEPLLRHTDGDVQVAVASCISEITRITAPEAPYTDEQMKEVFQLIVSSFGDLSDLSSRSYDKRASILETVAKVRSCVVMLDLECDALITKMFQHFLSSIREEHPENISASMETIMTLVLEESEDVPLELLTPILASLKRNNEEIPTAARKLGENVFAKCAVKLKPYFKQAVKVLGLPLDGYSEIVSTICNDSNGEAEHKDGNVSSLEQLPGEGNLTTSAFVEASQDARDPVTEEPCLEDIPPEVQKSMKSLSNELTETGDEELSNVSENSKKPEESNPSKSLDVETSKVDLDDIDTAKASKVDIKQVKISKKRGRKPRSTKPSNPSRIGGDNEAEITCQKVSDKGAEESPDPGKDAHASVNEDPHIDTKASPAKEQVPVSSPEPLENEVNVSSGSPNKSLLDESPGVSRKEENLGQEDALMKSASGKDFAGTSGKEISQERHSEKDKLNLAQEDTLSMDSAPTEAADVNSDSEVKPEKRFGKEKESFVQEHESSEDPDAAIVGAADGGSDPEIKPCKVSEKKKGGQEDEPFEDLDSTKVSGGSSDSEKEVSKQSGKITENLAKEGTPVESLSPKVDDKISDSEDKPPRRSGKKATRSKKTTRKGRMPGRKGTTKIDTEVSSDEEAEPQKQSSEEDKRDLETKPSMPPGKQSTSRHKGKPLKNSGEGNVSETKLPSMKKDTANEGSGSDPETTSDESEPETTPPVQSGKGKRSRPRGKPRKSLGRGSVSGTKLPSKKEEATNMDKDLLRKNSERRAHGKNTKEKVLSKSQENDDDQDMVVSPKSTSKLVKDDDQLEDSKTNSKRKRTPGKVSGDLEHGVNLVGARIKVWWPDDEQYYEGVIESFDRAKKKHKVSYTDGDEEVLLLQKEKWELVDDGAMQEDTNEDSNPDSSAKSRSRKKSKESTVQTEKQKGMDVSPRSARRGAAASSKLKGTATKSGGKVDSRSRDKISKSTGKSEENSDSDDMSADDVPRAARKSKDNDGSMPRIKDKSKVETPKTVTKAKAKTPQGGNTSNGMGKAKSSLSKVKDSGKTPEIAKVKSADTSKAGKSRGSGKKRRRGY
ncbi:hypothetical protein POM88_023424 [Heracleum sosnowskyi]|uniref:Tudor domain-containing protein n=1 Tax=Heracleum sosnowskyi TaxID=360622 RepID=A0AAD8IH06_9APIA|nr:hypothetical protein POM88_023424 [Heracleum sosnowskyi]